MRFVYGEKRNACRVNVKSDRKKTQKANNARRLYGDNQYTTLYGSKWFMLTREIRRMEKGEMLVVRAVSRIVTNSIEQSPSWELNRFSATQEIPCILWNPKVHNRIHKSASCHYPEIYQSSPCPSIQFLEDSFLYYPPSTLRSPKWSFPPIFPHLYAPLLFPHAL